MVARGRKRWKCFKNKVFIRLCVLLVSTIIKTQKNMNETKMKSILDEYLCKSNSNMQNLLDKKLNKLEENLKKDT